MDYIFYGRKKFLNFKIFLKKYVHIFLEFSEEGKQDVKKDKKNP